MKAAFKKPRVALFTPLPPCKTGTADYGVSLAEEMEKLVSLSVYEKEPFGFAPESFDSVVYQIGNNPYHTPIYKTALRHPGVVVLHEATVHNLVRSMTLNGSKTIPWCCFFPITVAVPKPSIGGRLILQRELRDPSRAMAFRGLRQAILLSGSINTGCTRAESRHL